MKHHHQHRIGNGKDDISNIRVAFFLNLGFAIIEIIGGLLTNSVAILSDALHDFGDSLTLGLAWYFQRLSKKNRDQKFSYGYSRFSLMGAIVSSVILIIGSIFIINEAIPRLIEPQEAHAGGMASLAILGIVVNGAAALRLRRGSSMNERVVALHLLEDVLGWTAVLIGAIIMHFKDWPWIDPFLSLLIAAIILFNVYRNLKKTLKIILQSTPEGIDPSELRIALNQLDWIENVKDLHVWSLDGEYNILTADLSVSSHLSLHELEALKEEARDMMAGLNVQHCTFEFSPHEGA